jgi:hypothetical protein
MPSSGSCLRAAPVDVDVDVDDDDDDDAGPFDSRRLATVQPLSRATEATAGIAPRHPNIIVPGDIKNRARNRWS